MSLDVRSKLLNLSLTEAKYSTVLNEAVDTIDLLSVRIKELEVEKLKEKSKAFDTCIRVAELATQNKLDTGVAIAAAIRIIKGKELSNVTHNQ